MTDEFYGGTTAKELFLAAKDINIQAQNLIFTIKEVMHCSLSGLKKHDVELQAYITKCNKISGYVTQTNDSLFELLEKLEQSGFKLTDDQITEREGFKYQHEERPIARKHDPDSRPTKGRQDSTSKQVSKFSMLDDY